MKKFYSLFSFILCFQLVQANEVPNPGFETWTAGNPDSWFVSNIPVYGISVTQFSPGHLSSFAAKGQPAKVIATGDTLPPVIASGNGTTGVPITVNYSTLDFYYQCNLTSGDVFSVIVSFTDAGSAIVAVGSVDITANASGWTHQTVTLTYYSTNQAVSALIQFTLSPDPASDRSNPMLSSSFMVDDVSLTGLVGINEINSTSDLMVFPVPAHERISINMPARNDKPLHLMLTDVSGRIVIERDSNAPDNDLINDALNLQGIVPGFYSLILTGAEKRMVRKVLIE